MNKRFWNFEPTEQGNTPSFWAALDVSVRLDLVFDGCNKSLVGNRFRYVVLNTHLSACLRATHRQAPVAQQEDTPAGLPIETCESGETGTVLEIRACASPWLVWSLRFIWSLWFVWFNRMNQTDQITVFLRWRTFSASC